MFAVFQFTWTGIFKIYCFIYNYILWYHTWQRQSLCSPAWSDHEECTHLPPLRISQRHGADLLALYGMWDCPPWGKPSLQFVGDPSRNSFSNQMYKLRFSKSTSTPRAFFVKMASSFRFRTSLGRFRFPLGLFPECYKLQDDSKREIQRWIITSDFLGKTFLKHAQE